MKALATIGLLIMFNVNGLSAQTLQQITDNGSTTTNNISVASVTANSPSLAGVNTPTNISMLHGYRINGSIPDGSHNGITYQSGGGGGAAISFFRGGSYDTGIDFYTNLNNTYGNLQHRMRIASNGNVGIGIANPLSNLHVNGIIRWGGYDTNYLYSGQDAGGSYFEQIGNTIQKSQLRIQSSKSGDCVNYSYFVIDPVNGFSFQTLGSGNGNVGIGTSDTKGYKLAVAGNMIAESVKVKLQGTWPDYVFAKSYKLPSLLEAEQHIKEKGHLQGIPSAEEVKANGIDLEEMNAKLLQKIEELTLHLIEQNKKMDLMKKDITILKSNSKKK